MAGLSATNLGACMALVFLALSSSNAEESRPNILVLYVDDLRHDGLASTGHPFSVTPNLDGRVAGAGTVFNNSFVTTPVCSPSRASLLSGQYTRTHGYYVNEAPNYVADSSTPNYHALLQQAGYRTGHIGKWHRDGYNDARPGYDYWAAFNGQGQHKDVKLKIQADGAPAQVVNTTGWTKNTLTNYAIDFLDDYGVGGSRSEPFALTLSFKAVHAPFGDGETASGGLFANEPVAAPASRTPAYGGFDVHDEKPIFDRPGFSGPNPTLDKGHTQQRSQMEMLTDIDTQIGRVLDTLNSQGLADNTIVVFTSDNGFFWGEHGRGDKRAAYEESIRVPLLIQDPRQASAPSTANALALNIDVAPTLLEAAGVAKPDWMQGRSLMPILRGESTTTRTGFAAEYYQEVISPNVPSWEAYRTEQHLLVRYTEFGAEYDELYDLQADPLQMNNLLAPGSPTRQVLQLRDALRSQLNEELSQIDATNGFRRELVFGDTGDFGIDESGAIIDSRDNVYVGARAGTGGSNLILSFELPPVPVTDRVKKAYLGFEIINSPGNPTAGQVIDLWAIGISDGERLAEFLESDVETGAPDRADNLKLQDSIITNENHFARNFSSDAAAASLAAYLNGFYEANPDYAGGKFLQLRLNPDSDFGAVNRAWTVANADVENLNSGATFYKRLPALSLEVAPELPGDFNADGSVDAADYSTWRDALGHETYLPGDPTPGSVTVADYHVWRENFGRTPMAISSAPAPSTAVPEPSTIVLLLSSLGPLLWRLNWSQPQCVSCFTRIQHSDFVQRV